MDPRDVADGRPGSMLTIVRGAGIYSPEPLGNADVVLADGRIASIAAYPPPGLPEGLVHEVDLSGQLLAPGLVDCHVHFLGGGGGDGYDSRAPELQLSDFTLNGITTAVAPLGIDPVSRSLEGLVAKARALTTGGISAYVYTGGFRKPLLNLTGSPWRDAYLIPDVLGVKLAIGVERAPAHARRDLADLSRELYWVERATGRAIGLHVHLGTLAEGHALVQELVDDLARPDRLIVTHCNRSDHHIETAIALASRGVWTDFTCMISVERGLPGSIAASDAVLRLREAGAPLDHVTLSTDGNGSVPEREADGAWAPYRTHMSSLLEEMRLLLRAGLSIDRVLALASSHPAEALGLDRKGRLRQGADADLVSFGPDLEVLEVFARGRRLVAAGRPLVLGRYERTSR
jgi:beta-aspartyl-dipeptidase (metallo-type)